MNNNKRYVYNNETSSKIPGNITKGLRPTQWFGIGVPRLYQFQTSTQMHTSIPYLKSNKWSAIVITGHDIHVLN